MYSLTLLYTRKECCLGRSLEIKSIVNSDSKHLSLFTIHNGLRKGDDFTALLLNLLYKMPMGKRITNQERLKMMLLYLGRYKCHKEKNRL